jgi:hypothetical protein
MLRSEGRRMGLPVSTPVIEFVAGKTDADLAAEFRAELRPLVEQIAKIMERARRHGLNTGFAITWDAYGRAIVQQIDVTRPL